MARPSNLIKQMKNRLFTENEFGEISYGKRNKKRQNGVFKYKRN